MARLKEYNGHYCESEYEYAFIGFLETEGWKYTSGNKLSRVTTFIHRQLTLPASASTAEAILKML